MDICTTTGRVDRPILTGCGVETTFSQSHPPVFCNSSALTSPLSSTPAEIAGSQALTPALEVGGRDSSDLDNVIEVTRSFRFLNSPVRCTICDLNTGLAARAINRVEMLFSLIEKTLSRDQYTSELSNLNRSPGKYFPASGMLLQAVSGALEAARLTEGLFDPTLASFEETECPAPRQHPDWRKIDLDPVNHSILLPPGGCLDLEDFIRGWSIDQAFQILRNFSKFQLEIGDNTLESGRSINNEAWHIRLEKTPQPGQDFTGLPLNGGAVCTAAVDSKRHPAGLTRPRVETPSGQFEGSHVLSVTVITESAARAAILSGAAMRAGPMAGWRLIQKQSGCQGLMLLDDGRQFSFDGRTPPLA